MPVIVPQNKGRFDIITPMKQSISKRRIFVSLLLGTGVAIGLFLAGALRNHSLDYWYLPYNLLLAFIPLLLSLWLVRLLKIRRWKSGLPIIITALWLLFLPNSFYIVTDFIHLPEHQRVDIVQDTVMLMQFSLLGLAFGFISLYQIHKELLKRLSAKKALWSVGVTLFLASFAIYLGRDLRWNSWDVVVQPFGFFADVVERIINPFGHPVMWSIMVSFFAMLASIYFILYSLTGIKK